MAQSTFTSKMARGREVATGSSGKTKVATVVAAVMVAAIACLQWVGVDMPLNVASALTGAATAIGAAFGNP